MLSSIDKDVAIYLYKCLLRRQQALQFLKPINKDSTQFNEVISMLVKGMSSEDICEADKHMMISRAEHLDIYVDASAKCHDNPKTPNKASISFIVYEDGKVIYEKAQYLGSTVTLTVNDKPVKLDITVNVGEYLALIGALEFIIDNEFKGNVTIYSDSLLIVSQVNFTSSARAPKLIVLRDYVHRLRGKLYDVQIIHLDRENNASADALAKSAIKSIEEDN